jgi:hypothetical protein
LFLHFDSDFTHTFSEAGMGGNGPQHTFELRGAIGSETTIARLTQSSAFCCARCACEFFWPR